MPDPDESLAEAVAQTLRDQDDTLDPRLEQYALGTLDPHELRMIEAEAENNPKLREQLELMAPLSAEFQERLVKEAERSSQERPRRWWLLAPAVPIAAAAVFLLTLRIPGPAPLPGYTLTVKTEISSWRGQEPEAKSILSFSADEIVRITMQSEESIQGITARLEVHPPGTKRIVVSSTPEISEDGCVQWKEPAGALAGGQYGRVTLTAFVAQPGSLPPLGTIATEGTGWRAERMDIEVRPPSESDAPPSESDAPP